MKRVSLCLPLLSRRCALAANGATGDEVLAEAVLIDGALVDTAFVVVWGGHDIVLVGTTSLR